MTNHELAGTVLAGERGSLILVPLVTIWPFVVDRTRVCNDAVPDVLEGTK